MVLHALTRQSGEDTWEAKLVSVYGGERKREVGREKQCVCVGGLRSTVWVGGGGKGGCVSGGHGRERSYVCTCTCTFKHTTMANPNNSSGTPFLFFPPPFCGEFNCVPLEKLNLLRVGTFFPYPFSKMYLQKHSKSNLSIVPFYD